MDNGAVEATAPTKLPADTVWWRDPRELALLALRFSIALVLAGDGAGLIGHGLAGSAAVAGRRSVIVVTPSHEPDRGDPATPASTSDQP